MNRMIFKKQHIFFSAILLTVLLSGIFPYAAFHHHHHDRTNLCELDSKHSSSKHKPKEHIHETHPSCTICDEVIQKNAGLLPGLNIVFKGIVSNFYLPSSSSIFSVKALGKLSRGPPSSPIG